LKTIRSGNRFASNTDFCISCRQDVALNLYANIQPYDF
jgi:hypothetical protein